MTDSHEKTRAGWTRLRLTRAGWLFLLMTFLVTLAAIRSEAALMLTMCGALGGGLIASAALAWRMVTGISVRRDMLDRAWQNQTVHLAYHLRNKRRGSCLGLRVQEIASKGLDCAAGYCVQLPPRAVFRAGARFVARRRGHIQLSAVELSTSFPFGLIVARRTIYVDTSMVIWPARGRLKCELLHRGAVETSSAPPSGATGGQDEFFGLREYRPGDNPRWIHWRRSAARQTPVVREMARPQPETLWLLLDTQVADAEPASLEALEKTLRFCATLIDHAMSRGYSVGLALAGADGPNIMLADEGVGHRGVLLDALADVGVNTNAPLDQTIDRLRRRHLAQGQAIVISSHSHDVSLAAVRMACRHLTVITQDNLSEVFEDIAPPGDFSDAT